MENNTGNKSARKWIVMLFLGPALFFLFYWLIVQGTPDVPEEKVPLPGKYNQSGEAVQVDNHEIKAGFPDRNIFTSELLIGNNNHVKVEAGKVFFIIPVFSRDYQFQPGDFILLDSRGGQYSSLVVDQAYLSRAVEEKKMEIPGQMPVSYLLFKVREDIKGYYLIMKEKREVAWYFEIKRGGQERNK